MNSIFEINALQPTFGEECPPKKGAPSFSLIKTAEMKEKFIEDKIHNNVFKKNEDIMEFVFEENLSQWYYKYAVV